MKKLLSCFFVLFACYSFGVAKEINVKFNNVAYVVDTEKGTAFVGKNYTKKYNAIAKGDVVIESSILYKKKSYPVTSIIHRAFMYCYDMTSLTIPGTITKIQNPVIGLYKLTKITVSPDNAYFTSVDGILFDKQLTEIICYPQRRAQTSYVLPPSVISIGDHAFFCSELKDISIPNGVKTIGASAFYSSNIESIVLPISVREVGAGAFDKCGKLSSIIYQNKKLTFSVKDSPKITRDKLVYQVPTDLFLELALKGKPEDQFKLAQCYVRGDGFEKNEQLALEWYRKAADQGHTLSQCMLGALYQYSNVIARDIKEAVAWYSKAAEGGLTLAKVRLADIYTEGKGVEQDYAKAFDLYKVAASEGDNKGAASVGHCYFYGRGVEKDLSQAIQWYEKSFAADAMAAYHLANCYHEGNGVAKNDTKALKFIEKAVESGMKAGEELLCLLAYNDAVENMNAKNHSTAISRFSTVLKYNKNNVNAYINRGYCQLNLTPANYADAKTDFEAAIRLEADNQVAKNNLQVVDQYYQKIADVQKYIDMGDQYYNQKNYQDAVSCYAKSIALDNTKPYPYYSIGYCFFDCKAYPEATKYFNEALRVDPNYADARKAIKNVQTVVILNTLSEAVQNACNSLNNSINQSYNSVSTSTTSAPKIGSGNSKYVPTPSTPTTTSTTGAAKKETCYMCDGKGYVRCGRCTDGYSSWTSKTVCTHCNGTNRVKCATCYGTGKY